MYSIGLILFNALTGGLRLNDASLVDFEVPDEWDLDLLDLLSKATDPDHTTRLTSEQFIHQAHELMSESTSSSSSSSYRAPKF